MLQGRRAYTGAKGLHHVRIALGSFAAGGPNNPLGLPVFLRFRMSSDVATAIGSGGGWYIDNLVIVNLDGAGCSGPLAKVDVSDGLDTRDSLAGLREDLKRNADRTVLSPRG